MIQLYRLYNPNTGDHLYTISAYERQVVQGAGWSDESAANPLWVWTN